MRNSFVPVHFNVKHRKSKFGHQLSLEIRPNINGGQTQVHYKNLRVPSTPSPEMLFPYSRGCGEPPPFLGPLRSKTFCCVGRRATGTFCRPANEHRMAHEGRTGFQLPGDIGASPASMTVLILDDGVSYRRVPPRAAGCRDLSFSFPVKDLNGWTTYRLVRRSAAKERPPSEPTVRRP